jgi:hypothetical protein
MEENNTYNIYCDESRIENKDSNNMAIGAIFILRKDKNRILSELKNIYTKNGFDRELKWSKLNKKFANFYKDIINFFLNEKNINYQCIIVDKNKVDLNYHNGDWELAFYKFYYLMLKNILSNNGKYYIFLDKKPTISKHREKGLFHYLSLHASKLSNCRIKHLQSYDSKDNIAIQLTDFLTGMISFQNNNKAKNSFKTTMADSFEEKLASMKQSKVNIFTWQPNDRNKNNNI